MGGHLVVRPHPKPLGQDHEPTGTQPDGVTDARGAAIGIERTGGAIVPPVFSLSHNCINKDKANIIINPRLYIIHLLIISPTTAVIVMDSNEPRRTYSVS